jgi:hypothetical protein
MADPRTNVNNPLGIKPAMIYGTPYENTGEGVAAFAKQVRETAVARERDRRAANDRRDRGDYGIELSGAFAALRAIQELEYPADNVDDAGDAVDRAMIHGYTGDDYIPDRLDETVDALNTYASDLANQLLKLGELAYTIRHGRESTDS